MPDVVRDEQNQVMIYISSKDKYITLTPNWLGVIGFMYSGAYIGSAIFSEIDWNSEIQEVLRARIKATIATEYEIITDSQNFMSWDVRELRSELQEYEMEYNTSYLKVPSFLSSGPISQVYSFLKGYALGQFSTLFKNDYEKFGTIRLDVKSLTLYDSLKSLLQKFNIGFSFDDLEMFIYLTDSRLADWIFNQESDFQWT